MQVTSIYEDERAKAFIQVQLKRQVIQKPGFKPLQLQEVLDGYDSTL